MDNKQQVKKAKSGSTANVLNVPSKLQWKPQYAMSEWVNEQLHDMVTVVISLTGGVDIDKECKVFVSDNNNDLVVSEKMISMLADVNLMHKPWTNKKKGDAGFHSNDPKITGFHRYFSTIRKKEDDDIYTTAIIPLPFPVQKTIVSLHKLGNKGGARVLYVDLRAMNYDEYKSISNGGLLMVD